MNKLTKKLKVFLMTPEYIFAVLALVFGLASAVLTPQLIANDENMHFIRSYALTDLEVQHECSLPVDIKERGFYAIYGQEKPDYSFNTKSVDEGNMMQTDCGTASSYNPLLHLPQAVGMEVAKTIWPSTGAMILFGRVLNVIVYVVGLFFIIRFAKIGKWLLAVIGLLPMMVHMSGTLTGDVVNNLIVLGFISYIFNLFVQKTAMTRRQAGVLLTLAGLLAVTKPTNLVLLLPILFLPKKTLPVVELHNKKISTFAIRMTIATLSGLLALGVLFTWMQIQHNSALLGDAGAKNPIIENPLFFLEIIFNTYINPDIILGGISYSDWLMRGAVGSFASFRYHLPFSLVFLLLTVFVFIGLRNDTTEQSIMKHSSKALLLSALASFIVVVMAMTYGLYVAWALTYLDGGEQYALGLQGRYFTPLLFLLAPALIYIRRFISVNIAEGIATGVIVFIGMGFSLVYYTIQTVSYIEKLNLLYIG